MCEITTKTDIIWFHTSPNYPTPEHRGRGRGRAGGVAGERERESRRGRLGACSGGGWQKERGTIRVKRKNGSVERR